MSIFAGKRMLFIGNGTKVFKDLEQLFTDAGLKVEIFEYEEANRSAVMEAQTDLILIDCLSEKQKSLTILNDLRAAGVTKNVPVVALTPNDDAEIQSMLTLGAADYFLESEDLPMIETKMQVLLGQSNNFAGATVIDIPADNADLNKKGVKVFVVEDDQLLRNLLTDRFTQSEFPFEFSTDGKDALTKIKKFKPQVIILDLMLPGMNGLDLLAEIKSDKETNDIPVIVFSNRDEQSDRARATELGAKGFYVKALTDLSKLVEKVGELA